MASREELVITLIDAIFSRDVVGYAKAFQAAQVNQLYQVLLGRGEKRLLTVVEIVTMVPQPIPITYSMIESSIPLADIHVDLEQVVAFGERLFDPVVRRSLVQVGHQIHDLCRPESHSPIADFYQSRLDGLTTFQPTEVSLPQLSYPTEQLLSTEPFRHVVGSFLPLNQMYPLVSPETLPMIETQVRARIGEAYQLLAKCPSVVLLLRRLNLLTSGDYDFLAGRSILSRNPGLFLSVAGHCRKDIVSRLKDQVGQEGILSLVDVFSFLRHARRVPQVVSEGLLTSYGLPYVNDNQKWTHLVDYPSPRGNRIAIRNLAYSETLLKGTPYRASSILLERDMHSSRRRGLVGERLRQLSSAKRANN